MKKILLAVVLLALLATAAILIVRKNNKTASTQSIPITAPVSASSYTPGTYNESLVTPDGHTRTYLLHIPTDYSPTTSYPLVLVFHGGKGTGSRILTQTKFAEKADAEGFIVVAPDGIENSWNDGRGTAQAEEMGVDDVAFVRTLISSLQKQLPTDTKRIYATGASNGGMMTYRLGCEMGDVFAAIGPDIANLPAPLAGTCMPSPIALVTINGLADPLIPYSGGACCGNPDGLLGGEGGVVLSTLDTIKKFATANGCSSTYTATTLPILVRDGTSVEKRTYNNCPAGKEIVSYVVAGMGHGWPPTPATIERISGKTSQNINATDVFWDFFAAHPKR